MTALVAVFVFINGIGVFQKVPEIDVVQHSEKVLVPERILPVIITLSIIPRGGGG